MTKNGASLVEVMIMGAIMGIIMLSMVGLQSSQMKSNNFLQFQMLRTQLQSALIGQVLNDPTNCACLFAGATAFPVAPTAPGTTLAGYTTPTELGRFSSGCISVPEPLVTSAGQGGLQMTNVQLTSIMNISTGIYSGNFVLNLRSTKQVQGPSDLSISIPVNVTVSPPVSGNVNFLSCSISSGTPGKQGFCTPNVNWDNSNTMTCPAVTGYTSHKLTGINQSATWYRSTSCCYIPDTPGSNGWCSQNTESWGGSGSGCGSSFTYYTAVQTHGIVASTFDKYNCCYVPNALPVNATSFSSNPLSADNYWSGCGGPYAAYDIIEQNVVTGGLGRSGSCTWIPK